MTMCANDKRGRWLVKYEQEADKGHGEENSDEEAGRYEEGRKTG